MNAEDRYARHLALPGVGPKGQKKLAESNVLVIGAGGLGSPVLLYLAAAGVGRIGIVDDDVVSLSNLQRQVIHSSAHLGEKKVHSAKRRINELNDDVNVVVDAGGMDLDEGDAFEVVKEDIDDVIDIVVAVAA